MAIALLVVGSIVLVTLALIILPTTQYLDALRDRAMQDLGEFCSPALKIKSSWIAVGIPVVLTLFNVGLTLWQLTGKP